MPDYDAEHHRIRHLPRFVAAAEDYCRTRTAYLDACKALRGEGCEWKRYGDDEAAAAPCCDWRSEIFDDREDWCEECAPLWDAAQLRHRLRPQLAPLARAMLQAFRRLEVFDADALS